MNLFYNKKGTQYRSTEFLKILSYKSRKHLADDIVWRLESDGCQQRFIQMFDYYYIVTMKIYQVTIMIN